MTWRKWMLPAGLLVALGVVAGAVMSQVSALGHRINDGAYEAIVDGMSREQVQMVFGRPHDTDPVAAQESQIPGFYDPSKDLEGYECWRDCRQIIGVRFDTQGRVTG